MIISAITAIFIGATPLPSSALVASEVIRAGDTVTLQNTSPSSGVLSEEDEALIGQQVRKTVYIGKPVIRSNTRAPFVVKRNQTVTVKYVSGSLEITMSGRAMENASAGEPVSVMNASSRELVNGIVTNQGWVLVQ